MSWRCGTLVIEKAQAEDVLQKMAICGEVTKPAIEQWSAATRAAIELLKTVPGPKVVISMGGHANGEGWKIPPNKNAEFITITVTQHEDQT